MEVSWDVEPDVMIQQLTTRYVAAIRRGLLEIANRRAPEITAWMQANRPWTDRTSEARTTLHTDVEQVEQDLVELLLQHGATHGWYLEGKTPLGVETMQGGKFSVLAPAVDTFGPVIMADIRKLVGG